ncbi:MAG: ATP-binding protein [Bacilli bacterium]|nr:ATP-binding protein [Bacilli bacterium]
MKLLKIWTNSGYKMLKKGFEINFLTKTRVDKDSENDDLIKLENNLYYPVETVFIGKNSSGKTTALALIELIIEFIDTGRVNRNSIGESDNLSFGAIFYHEKMIYKYEGVFAKDNFSNRDYLVIKDESLFSTRNKNSYKKDLSNIAFTGNSLIQPSIGRDTSDISRFSFSSYDCNINKLIKERNVVLFSSIVNSLYGNGTFNTLIHMFDDSIEYIGFEHNENNVDINFKRINQKEKLVSLSYLKEIMSAGTYRGLFLFAASMVAFKTGGTIIIDEIENSFNKNLIQNLFVLFKDARINKMGATLIYSTHYSELLDESDRCDNINVVHRYGDSITCDNMCTSYNLRTELSKSNQFDQNAFDNFANYERLADLRKILIK